MTTWHHAKYCFGFTLCRKTLFNFPRTTMCMYACVCVFSPRHDSETFNYCRYTETGVLKFIEFVNIWYLTSLYQNKYCTTMCMYVCVFSFRHEGETYVSCRTRYTQSSVLNCHWIRYYLVLNVVVSQRLLLCSAIRKPFPMHWYIDIVNK